LTRAAGALWWTGAHKTKRPENVCYDEATMSAGPADQDRELLRYWVETWQRAGVELDEIRRHEIESADTQEAIRQLFGTAGWMDSAPPE
jgi:hypothetical protein